MPGAFPGTRDAFLELIHPEDYDRVTQAIAHPFETRAPYNIEYRIRRLDGETRWIAVWGIIPEDLSTAETQLIGVISDITNRQQAEAALRDSEERFRATFEQAAVGIVQANLAGEFLQVNQKFCDTLEPGKRNQLAIINRSGQHLLNLINDILEMSKIEAGRTQFVANSFDLYTQLNTLEEMFYLRAIDKNLQFRVDCDPAVPRYIQTDENKLRQVLINLIGNAIKFTPLDMSFSGSVSQPPPQSRP